MSRQVETEGAVRRTARATDITGHENLLILLAAPGDESAFGTLIAELCARGRPPFVAVVGDGAPDGSAAAARVAERASRATLARWALPPERLLFVGLRQGRIPAPDAALFGPLKAAMALLSWRNDCNVVGASAGRDADGDRAAVWTLARRIAEENRLTLVAEGAGAGPATATAWVFDRGAGVPSIFRTFA